MKESFDEEQFDKESFAFIQEKRKKKNLIIISNDLANTEEEYNEQAFNELLEYYRKENRVKNIYSDELNEDGFSDKEIFSYVAENLTVYPEYNIGDIIYAKEFTYKNGEKGKNHMFIIIGKNNFAVPIEYFTLIISSKMNKLKFKENILLKKDTKNNLSKDSIVKTDWIYNIAHNNTLFYIGKVEKSIVNTFIKLAKKNTR